MRVLWFAMTPGCYDVVNTGSWIEALQKIFAEFLPNVELGLAFEHTDGFKIVKRNGVTYYPLGIHRSSSPQQIYEELRPYYIKAIEDFKPDVVHCFGTERWHYGLLAKAVNVPFVVHIMGFMNIYDAMEESVLHPMDYWKYFGFNPLKYFVNKRTEQRTRLENQELEKQVMSCNHYFMGRTEWDRNIVKYYSPGSRYFHCPEAIRDAIYSSKHHWNYHGYKKLRLLTVGNAGSLKGNEIMLKAARLLKYKFGVNFEWRYTSDAYKMSFFERVNDIQCRDVNINLIGRLNANQIADELAEADFYIHPSIIDNSPNTVCEAQLIGTPVIAANVGGIPQLVEEGVSGWLYPYNEYHTLAFRIMNLMNVEEELSKVSSNEIAISRKRHDPKLIASSICHIYDTIIEDYRK